MSAHDWGPSTLNHGSQQCRRCLCTYEEAQFALGMECRLSGIGGETKSGRFSSAAPNLSNLPKTEKHHLRVIK